MWLQKLGRFPQRCLIFLACFLYLSAARAEVAKEYQIKAVFLFRLAQFVDWPTNAFANEKSPIIIGVIGDDPFGESLDLAVQGETAHGRPLKVQRFGRLSEIRECHVLYISTSETARVMEITKSLSARSILTVSDIQEFMIKYNGMIRFLTENNKVTIRINSETAKSAGLTLNSRLLRMADVVPRR